MTLKANLLCEKSYRTPRAMQRYFIAANRLLKSRSYILERAFIYLHDDACLLHYQAMTQPVLLEKTFSLQANRFFIMI